MAVLTSDASDAFNGALWMTKERSGSWRCVFASNFLLNYCRATDCSYVDRASSVFASAFSVWRCTIARSKILTDGVL